MCGSGDCSSEWALATYDISTSTLLRLDSAKVIIWSVMTVICAGKRRLLLLELTLTSFRRAEAICMLRLAGARAFSCDNTVVLLMALIAHYETASVDFTSFRRLHKLVIILLVLLVYLNGRLYLRCQLRVEVVERRVGILASLCLRQSWLLLDDHRVDCLIS